VAENGHSDPGAEIEIAPTLGRVEVRAFAALEGYVEPIVGRHHGRGHQASPTNTLGPVRLPAPWQKRHFMFSRASIVNFGPEGLAMMGVNMA
jgi:hypothetical protein